MLSTRIAILIFDELTALDAIGPYEVLSRIPGVELRFVAKEPGVKRTDTGALGMEADLALGDLPDPDVVLVPGGQGNRPLLEDDEVLDWLRAVRRGDDLDNVGLHGLVGPGRCGHPRWQARDDALGLHAPARGAGRRAGAERVVEDGKILTAAGVSAGIDMALTLAARMAGDTVAQAIQLGIEYDPDPPFDSGSPDKAPPELVDLIRSSEG